MIKQDAGTKQLGDIAPKFAQLNDEVLFGEYLGKMFRRFVKMEILD